MTLLGSRGFPEETHPCFPPAVAPFSNTSPVTVHRRRELRSRGVPRVPSEHREPSPAACQGAQPYPRTSVPAALSLSGLWQPGMPGQELATHYPSPLGCTVPPRTEAFLKETRQFQHLLKALQAAPGRRELMLTPGMCCPVPTLTPAAKHLLQLPCSSPAAPPSQGETEIG